MENKSDYIKLLLFAGILLFFRILSEIDLNKLFYAKDNLKEKEINLLQTKNTVATKLTKTSNSIEQTPPKNNSHTNSFLEEKKSKTIKQPLTPHSEIFKKNPGESFFFGRFEQDANFKNGPETIEWKYADILFSETFDIRTEYAKKYKSFLDKYQPDEFTENYSEKWLYFKLA